MLNWLVPLALLCSLYLCNGFTLNPCTKCHLSLRRSNDMTAPGVPDEGVVDQRSIGFKSFDPKGTRKKSGGDTVGGYDPGEALRSEELNVGDPQIRVKEKERSVTSILKELAAIQQQGPQKYCILGTRHCSYLHQQIIELL
jgi:hypothetical protein